MYERPFLRGKLYIHFTVEFPESFPKQEGVLPPRPSMQMADMELDECEETTLHDVNIEEEMRRKQQEAYDEDDDMHGEDTMWTAISVGCEVKGFSSTGLGKTIMSGVIFVFFIPLRSLSICFGLC